MPNEILFPSNWYNELIEEPVRELVYILRNNGFNTECSCGHDMYIQCQYIPDGEMMTLQKLIYCYLHEKKLPINYDINIIIRVIDGCPFPTLRIDLNPKY